MSRVIVMLDKHKKYFDMIEEYQFLERIETWYEKHNMYFCVDTILNNTEIWVCNFNKRKMRKIIYES